MTTLPSVEQQARVFAALADPVRVRFVHEVACRGERRGGEIADALGISLALLCHHGRILVDAGVLAKRKEGQTTHYRLEKGVLEAAVRQVVHP